MADKQDDITLLLHAWREGNVEAENQLFSLVIPDLRRIARLLMKREPPGHSMQATELVDQIYLRLVAAKDRDWQNRRHFYSIAARAMRRYLIDHARRRSHDDFVEVELIEDLLSKDDGSLEMALTVDNLLSQLAQIQPDLGQVVELKYFLGLTDVEVANVLGMNLRTMKRRWRDARLWLFDRISSGDGGPNGGSLRKMA
jgi:RNA polymerase sigma factor (TIGR02999 family)